MKVKRKVWEEVDIKTLKVSAGVRWDVEDDDGQSFHIPCRIDDRWVVEIDLDTGTITNWEKGQWYFAHFKVCDDGNYSLYDNEGKLVKEWDGYVPFILCPEECGYGDYIIMNIDKDGQIRGWEPYNVERWWMNEMANNGQL